MAEENDAEETDQDNAGPSALSASEMLREAREQKNLDIEDIAKTTRIPQRHLESIETGDYSALPGRTYAIGFAKSYARTVGLSEVEISAKLREEMEDQGQSAYEPEVSPYSPTSPSNMPPKYLAWTAGGIAAVLLIGFLIWRTMFLEPTELIDGELDTVAESGASDRSLNGPAEPAGPAPSTTGTVVLTATEAVWLRVYDDDGERLFEKEMAAGEQYTVPEDANKPQILTGRPDALTVTIDGAVVPPLGQENRTIKDVGISASDLLARNIPGGSAGNVDPIAGDERNSAQ
ncbi:RodZ domain-containing protein [Parasphingorhabdus sp. JC815]|uniref:helix-turn-helix domain-containing protein n=1 Tax=Parasphingorhabdus sp. JC815 TaxID=3232140 RepID=UPI003459C6A8